MGEVGDVELDVYRHEEGPVDLELYDLAQGINSAVMGVEDAVGLFMEALELGRRDREALTLALGLLTGLQEDISVWVEKLFNYEDEI